MRPNGFRIVRRTQRWIHPDDHWLTPQPPAAPFDPAPFAGAYQPDLSIIPAARWAVPPELPWEGLEPPPAPPFDPAQGGMWEEQPGQERSLALRWFVPDDAFEGLTPPPEPEVPELVPPVMVGGTNGVIGDSLLARTHIWYQVDWHHPVIPYDPAKQGPHSTPDLSLQDQWNWPHWYQPEDATEGLVPPAEAPFDPAPYAGAYQGDLRDSWLPTTWFVPDDQWWVPIVEAPAFDPAPFAGSYQPDLHDRWLPTQWFTPEAGADGPVPITPPVFDPSLFAGAYQEQREDRYTQPVWYQREDDWRGQVPAEAPFDPAPFAGLFGLDQVGAPLIWQLVIETEAGPLVSPEAQRAGLWADEVSVRLPARWYPGFDNESYAATFGVEPSFFGGFPPSGVAYNALVASAAETSPPASIAGHDVPAGEGTAATPGGIASAERPEAHG